MIEINPQRNFALIGSYFFFLIVVVVSSKECDKSKCPGPLRLYEDLDCIPIREMPGDCCAVRYDCSHVYRRSSDKCYANGHEYSIGESLRDEDRINPCDKACHCTKHEDATSAKYLARFRCAILDCPRHEPKPNCYFKRKFDSCCDVEEICRDPKDDPKCLVDGRTYLHGQRFYPSSNFSLLCQCEEGYTGENVAPFCQKASCGVEAQNVPRLRNLECAPLYRSHLLPPVDCYSKYMYQCPKDNDKILRPSNDRNNEQENDLNVCKFGNLTLHVGDKLDDFYFRGGCRECICEVPPTLTCKLLPLSSKTSTWCIPL